MILKTQDKMNRVYSQNLLIFDFASTDREKERKNLMIEKSNTAIPVAEKQTTSSQIRFITITAMFIALTYVFTAFVNIKLPIAANGGLIHLGNVPLFIGAILFGKKTGAIAGGVGMGLFDLLSGWTAWAPFTLVIVGLMGFAVLNRPAGSSPLVCLVSISFTSPTVRGVQFLRWLHFGSINITSCF